MSDIFHLLPAPEPQAEAGTQDDETDDSLRTLPNGDELIGPMTVAYVCIGCAQILQRLVVDWVYPTGQGFQQAVVASRNLARELGLEGDVPFARRLDRPELGAYGTIGFGSQLAQVRNPQALRAWPTMWEYSTINALQRIRRTRSEIKFPYFLGAVEQFRKKVMELARATFIAPGLVQ